MSPLDTLSRYLEMGNWLAFLLGGIVFFLLFREVATWYWKINKAMDLLEKIEENTRSGEKTTSDDDLGKR